MKPSPAWTLIAALAALVVGPRASAEEPPRAQVYDSPSSLGEVTLVPTGPASAHRFIAAVRGVPDPKRDGILLVEMQTLAGEQRTYTGVGGVGSFWLEDLGRQTLVGGTLVHTVDLASAGVPAVGLVLSKDKSAKADGAAILREYASAQGEADPTASQADLSTAIRSAVSAEAAVCGGAGPQVRVDWPSFQKAGGMARVGGVTRVLQALQDLCADAAYRTAVAKLGTLSVTAASAQTFSLHGDSLQASFGPALENVRLCAQKWLKANL